MKSTLDTVEYSISFFSEGKNSREFKFISSNRSFLNVKFRVIYGDYTKITVLYCKAHIVYSTPSSEGYKFTVRVEF